MTNSNSILAKIWRRTDKYRFNILMAAVALLALRIPLQHFITLNRYQHVAISVFLFGIGYFMQLVWSWRTYTKWAKISQLSTGIFFASVGLFFYSNNWADMTMMELTPQRALHRYKVAFGYVCAALVVSLLWIRALWEDEKLHRKEKAALKSAEMQAKTSEDQTKNS